MVDIKRLLKSIIPFDFNEALYPFLLKNEWDKAQEVYSLLKVYFNSNSKTAEKIASDFTNEHLTKILTLAITSSKYYKNSVQKSIGLPGDLKQFPILTKEIIRSEFDNLVNSSLTSLKWFNFNTGGSTGEPLLFRVTRQCGLVDKVHQQYFFEKMGYRHGDKIFAFDGENIPPSKIRKNIFWTKTSFSQLPYGSLHFSSHYLNESNAIYYLNKILKEKPAILRGYPSFIAELAIYATQLGMKNFDFIKGILLTSEAILDYQITTIKQVFKAPVTLQYGHSEMSVFAVQLAEENEYWCSPFYGYTEVLNSLGEQVKIGEVGEIVVTSYFNTAMPFIRYRTGDYAEYGGKNNGATILRNLQGREQDFIFNERNEKVSITGLIFGRHYTAFKHIKKWQIHQSKPGEALILVIPGEQFNEDDKQELIHSFKNLAAVSAEVKIVSNIPLTQRGKFRFVIHEN